MLKLFTPVVVDHVHLEATRGLATFSTLETRIGKSINMLLNVAPHVVLAAFRPPIAHFAPPLEFAFLAQPLHHRHKLLLHLVSLAR